MIGRISGKLLSKNPPQVLLEAAGLAERRPDPTDRRVKRVALTKKGQKTKEDLRAQLYDPPEELVGLGRDDLERLLAAARKLDADQ